MNATPRSPYDPALAARADRVLDLLGGPTALPTATSQDLPVAPAPVCPPAPGPAPGRDAQRPSPRPSGRGPLAKLASVLARPSAPPKPRGSGGSFEDRKDLTRSLTAYRANPTEDHHLALLESISRSLELYVEPQERRGREERAQAVQNHRSAVKAHRVAVASMVFGAAGWIVALVQLLLMLFGVGAG